MSMDDELKKQLVEQLGAELGVKKENKDARFDSSTGTLYANDLRNYAVARIDNEQFTKGKAYESNGDIVNGRMRIIDDNNRPSNIHLDDYDFEFHLHVSK